MPNWPGSGYPGPGWDDPDCIWNYNLINLPFKFFITSFLVVPGLLLLRGDACLCTPLLPGLGNAEKLARFCESVIVGESSVLLFVRLFTDETESLNLLFFWIVSSSFRCGSCRTRLFAFERGIHLFMANYWPFPLPGNKDHKCVNSKCFVIFSKKHSKMADLSCIFSLREVTVHR